MGIGLSSEAPFLVKTFRNTVVGFVSWNGWDIHRDDTISKKYL